MEAIKGLERLISIWTERNVYEATFLVKLHKCLGEWIGKNNPYATLLRIQNAVFSK